MDVFKQALIDYLDGKTYTEALERVNFLPLFIRKTYIEITEDGFIIRQWECRDGRVYFGDEEIEWEEFFRWVEKFGDGIARYTPDELRKFEEYGYEYYGEKEHLGHTYITLKNERSIVDENVPLRREWIIKTIEKYTSEDVTYEVYGNHVYVSKNFGRYSVVVSGRATIRNGIRPVEVFLKFNENRATLIPRNKMEVEFENLIAALSASSSIEEFLTACSLL